MSPFPAVLATLNALSDTMGWSTRPCVEPPCAIHQGRVEMNGLGRLCGQDPDPRSDARELIHSYYWKELDYLLVSQGRALEKAYLDLGGTLKEIRSRNGESDFQRAERLEKELYEAKLRLSSTEKTLGVYERCQDPLSVLSRETEGKTTLGIVLIAAMSKTLDIAETLWGEEARREEMLPRQHLSGYWILLELCEEATAGLRIVTPGTPTSETEEEVFTSLVYQGIDLAFQVAYLGQKDILTLSNGDDLRAIIYHVRWCLASAVDNLTRFGTQEFLTRKWQGVE